MKRFWDEAKAEPDGDRFLIALDGKPMRLPGGAALSVRHADLAHAIAAEWHAAGGGKGGEMTFKDTPLTRLAGTAQERIAQDRSVTVDAIARYGESDLLCYRAESPDALVQRQHALWQPWLDWAAQALGAPLRVTAGVAYVKQHRDSIAALRSAVAGLDVDALAALGIAVPALGSLVLGLALAHGALDARAAFELSALDELFQAEQWGEDREAADRRSGMATDIALAHRYIRLTRGERP